MVRAMLRQESDYAGWHNALATLFLPPRPSGCFPLGYTQPVASLPHTNREIEVKLRVADVATALANLRRLGASERGRVLERNTLFDTPDSALRLDRCVLRVRKELAAASRTARAGRSRALVTFKAPVPATGLSRYKEKLERETAIHHPRRWGRMLRSLGFRPGFRYEKYRTSFHLSGLEVSLDETPVGIFLELEGPPRAIDRAARELGYSRRDYARETYWELYAADCRRRGRLPRNMLFHP
jgi:adenylate cyclase, class 2